MRLEILAAFVLFFPAIALAEPVLIAPSSAFGCKLTPTLPTAEDFYPGKGKVMKANKLSRAAGKAVLADGERLFFMGKILDERCMPVEGAHLELWQADTKGEYRQATPGQLNDPGAVFAGSGTAITNNLGEFQFDTIFPGPQNDRAPHLKLRITHPDLVPLVTEVYFLNDRRNVGDPVLMALAPDLRDRLMATMHAQEISFTGEGLRGYIEIVLRGKERFSEY